MKKLMLIFVVICLFGCNQKQETIYSTAGDRDSVPLDNSLIENDTYFYGVYIRTISEELDKFKENTKASPYWDFCIEIDSFKYKFNREDLKLLTNK